MMLRGNGHHREVGSVGASRPGPPALSRAVGTGIALVVIAAGICLGAGVTHARISGTQALFTSVASTQTNSVTAMTCLEPGQKQPSGAHLKKCPPTPPPPNQCKEDVLGSQSPTSAQNNPIGTVPVTLSAVYTDETPMNATTNPPTLSIDGTDQPDAWTNLLTSSTDLTKSNYHTTVSYTVPASYGDGDPHVFVITFYDGDADRSDGCGVATFYVQSPPPVNPPPPTATCHEDVLGSQSPTSSQDAPITALPATLTAVYTDEKQLNTTTKPPTLSIDGTTQANAWPSAFQSVDPTTQTGHDYVTPVSYDVPDSYADGSLHTFVITVYDGDNDGCGVATFYVKASTP